MRSYLDFEKPVAELEAKIEELRAMRRDGDASPSATRSRGSKPRPRVALKELYDEPDALAEDAGRAPSAAAALPRLRRRPDHRFHAARRRPQVRRRRGDRRRLRPLPAARASACIGHEKGSDTESRLKHNFGMARPEGYRKAVRLMEMADRFGIPVICAGRHRRRLSGHRRRGARPGRSDRALDRCLPDARRAERRDDPRRRRLGRRHRASPPPTAC